MPHEPSLERSADGSTPMITRRSRFISGADNPGSVRFRMRESSLCHSLVPHPAARDPRSQETRVNMGQYGAQATSFSLEGSHDLAAVLVYDVDYSPWTNSPQLHTPQRSSMDVCLPLERPERWASGILRAAAREKLPASPEAFYGPAAG